jgi:hypothetical protein
MRFASRCSIVLLLSSGCGYETGQLAPIEPDQDEIDALEICGGTPYGELKFRDGIDEACREEVEGLRPERATNLPGRLMLLGEDVDADGSPRMFLLGADRDGNPLSAAAWTDAELEVTAADGTVTLVGPERLEATPLANVGSESMAVAFVVDHSASMRDVDLQAVHELGGVFLDSIPPGCEGLVTHFSATAEVVQSSTTERDLLELALEPQGTLERTSTALYDGMGVTLAALGESSRPVRVMLLISDGPDFVSREYRRSEVTALVGEHRVAGVILGALFAETADVRSMFGERGVYFQSPSIPSSSADHLELFHAALREAVVLKVPAEFAEAPRFRVELDDLSVLVRR